MLWKQNDTEREGGKSDEVEGRKESAKHKGVDGGGLKYRVEVAGRAWNHT